MSKVSTTQLAKKQGMTAKKLFVILSDQGLIAREENSWILTPKGEESGGEYKESAKYGFNLIELEDKEVQNLDDILPRLLLKFGVQAY